MVSEQTLLNSFLQGHVLPALQLILQFAAELTGTMNQRKSKQYKTLQKFICYCLSYVLRTHTHIGRTAKSGLETS
jgi:hypothetical protein